MKQPSRSLHTVDVDGPDCGAHSFLSPTHVVKGFHLACVERVGTTGDVSVTLFPHGQGKGNQTLTLGSPETAKDVFYVRQIAVLISVACSCARRDSRSGDSRRTAPRAHGPHTNCLLWSIDWVGRLPQNIAVFLVCLCPSFSLSSPSMSPFFFSCDLRCTVESYYGG